MKEALIIVSATALLGLGIGLGYALGVQNTHKEAVAYGVGHYNASGPATTEFVWSDSTQAAFFKVEKIK